jgi:hypothetical protein
MKQLVWLKATAQQRLAEGQQGFVFVGNGKYDVT